MRGPVTPWEASASGQQSLPRWSLAVAIFTALLMGAGAIIALTRPQMLMSSADTLTEGVRIYAGYLVSRNLAIAAILLLTVAIKARRALANFMLLAALTQFVDALLDCLEGRWLLAPGIIFIGFALLLAATRVSGLPFWKRSFWLARH